VLELVWKYMHYIAELDTMTGALRPDVRSRRRSLAPWCGPRGSVGYQANGQRTPVVLVAAMRGVLKPYHRPAAVGPEILLAIDGCGNPTEG
jgi:hypothetical protein